MAYVSGSYPLDQRKFVRNLATESEVPTCQNWESESGEDGIQSAYKVMRGIKVLPLGRRT